MKIKEVNKQQKISFRVSEALLKLFNEELLKLPISKDLFLNNLIRTECEHLAADLDDKVLSKEAKSIISDHLKHMKGSTRQVSVVVDTEVAARLNEIVAEHNIVRDSFLNRIFYFLLLTRRLREDLNLPEEIDLINLHTANEKKCGGIISETIPTSPFMWLAQVLADPFRYLREELSRTMEEGENLYLIPMRQIGFTCYVEDIFLLGTNLSKQIDKELTKASKDF